MIVIDALKVLTVSRNMSLFFFEFEFEGTHKISRVVIVNSKNWEKGLRSWVDPVCVFEM